MKESKEKCIRGWKEREGGNVISKEFLKNEKEKRKISQSKATMCTRRNKDSENPNEYEKQETELQQQSPFLKPRETEPLS